MAKSRLVNTSFWSDGFIQELDSETKLLFLYLLTNEHTDICGVYEITFRTISFESGLSADSVSRSMDILLKNERVSYAEGWIFIKNFSKHQQNNPKVQTGIERGLKRVPQAVADRLCIDYDALSHFNFNFNFNFNSNLKRNAGAIARGKFENIFLDEDEYKILVEEFSVKFVDELIDEMSVYLQTHNKSYSDYFAAMHSWVKNKKLREANSEVDEDQVRIKQLKKYKKI